MASKAGRTWAEQKHDVLSHREGYGPNWRKVVAKHISENTRGKNVSSGTLALLDAVRPQHSPEYFRVLAMSKLQHSKRQSPRTAKELLILEDQVRHAPDAKAFVRERLINHLRGPRPTYELDMIRTLLAAGTKAGKTTSVIVSEIAKNGAIGISERHVYTVMAWIGEGDAA